MKMPAATIAAAQKLPGYKKNESTPVPNPTLGACPESPPGPLEIVSNITPACQMLFLK